MAKKKVYIRRHLPPCPDPDSYILVETPDLHYYWRRKRGTLKPAVLNETMQQNADLQRIGSPAASRILRRLDSFLKKFNKGRTYVKLVGKLLKVLSAKGYIDFSLLTGFEFNYDYPLDHLLRNQYKVEEKDGHLKLTIVQRDGSVKVQNSPATEYYYELVLLWGDATGDNSLQVRHHSSALYSYFDPDPPVCELELPLPATGPPWMAMLKIGGLEGNEIAHHPKHYGMKVVRVNP